MSAVQLSNAQQELVSAIRGGAKVMGTRNWNGGGYVWHVRAKPGTTVAVATVTRTAEALIRMGVCCASGSRDIQLILVDE